MLMNQYMNDRFVKEWTDKHGGVVRAAKLIAKALECSDSKSEKIAGCRYPSRLTAAEEKALAKLWKVSREVAFKPVSAGEMQAS